MADTSKKIDPIRDRYYQPLETSERVLSALFYATALLSLAAPLIDRANYPSVYDWIQIPFVVCVVALFIVSLTIRLYFSPRAQNKRYQDFLGHVFGVQLSHEQTSGYYTSTVAGVPKRVAAQLLENCFYSMDTIGQMAVAERAKVGVYLTLWVVVILNRTTDLEVAAIVAQAVFSEQILSRWLRVEWLRRSCEDIYEELVRLLKAGAQLDVVAWELLGSYEMRKAVACITFPSSIFEKRQPTTDAEWQKVRASLGL